MTSRNFQAADLHSQIGGNDGGFSAGCSLEWGLCGGELTMDTQETCASELYAQDPAPAHKYKRPPQIIPNCFSPTYFSRRSWKFIQTLSCCEGVWYCKFYWTSLILDCLAYSLPFPLILILRSDYPEPKASLLTKFLFQTAEQSKTCVVQHRVIFIFILGSLFINGFSTSKSSATTA